MNILFVFVSFLIDGIIMALFPADSAMQSVFFVSNLGFCAMVLTLKEYESINAYLFTICWGIFYDYFYAGTFLVYAIVFAFIAFLMQLWSKHVTDTILESLIICISTLFVKDCVVYFYMRFQSVIQMDIATWFLHREFLTILMNILLVILAVGIIHLKNDYLKRRELRIRKEEKIEWMKLR